MAEEIEKKKAGKKETIIAVVIIVVLLLGLGSCVSSCGSDDKSSSTEPAVFGAGDTLTDDEMTTLRSMVNATADKYVSNYDSPWGNDDWSIARWNKKGNYLVVTKYSFKNLNEKVPVIALVYTEDGNSYKTRFLQIGGKNYVNDNSNVTKKFVKSIAKLAGLSDN